VKEFDRIIVVGMTAQSLALTVERGTRSVSGSRLGRENRRGLGQFAPAGCMEEKDADDDEEPA